MKKLIVLPVLALLALPVMAGSTTTTTTESYEETTTPMLDNSDMIEAEEYDESMDPTPVEQPVIEEERMEDSSAFTSEEASSDMVDYSDRTRTNRERHALDTSGDASDDH